MQFDIKKHMKALELDKVLEMLADTAICADTKQKALKLVPAGNIVEARRELAYTSRANSLSNQYGYPGISQLKPCAEIAGRARVGGLLSMRELLDMAGILRSSRSLINWKKQSENEETPLDDIFSQLDSNKSLEEDIGECIISEEEISDRASPELYDIRRKIRQAELKAREHLDKMTRSQSTQKYLQELIVTMRNGRFVVPVKAEYRGEVKGIVHDTSSSGATIFIEPISVVEANNLIRELESREQHEILRILQELSGRVGENADMILRNYELIIELDLYFAKSRLADKMRAMAPTLSETGGTTLKKARHPLIQADKIVPIDISIGESFDTLVITGPNTGGKTVALKTLGLLTFMVMCGLMVPCADGSAIRIYGKVLADIGDEQSIEQSLSTFSAHMTNIISILEQVDDNTLVLIDELGAGTDPAEGAALAVAIIAELREKGANIAATTHYAEIKMYALQTDGVENGSCEFDVSTLRPTYRLLTGVPGRSNAFAISERLGLSTEVIERARNQMSRESTRFEDIVSGLEDTRWELEREKEQAERYRKEAFDAREDAEKQRIRLEAEKDKELKRAREQAMGVVEQVKFQADRLLTELEELKKQKDKADFSSNAANIKGDVRARLRELEDSANPVTERKKTNYRLPRKLKRGDPVQLTDFGSKGTVLADQDDSGYIQVQAGIIRTKVPISSVRLLENEKVTMEGKGYASSGRAVKASTEAVKTEIDLRGMDSNEAVMELEKYIDIALLSNITTVTAIHGKGTGALRTAVQSRLRSHKSVRTFRSGVYGEGESGVTVIELK